jgi:hypothetical protein
MKIFQLMIAVIMVWTSGAFNVDRASAADKPLPSFSAPLTHPAPGEVCKHADPTLPPQQRCVGEVMYRLCGCNNACQAQYGRPPGNTDPHWDARPLNRCLGDCGRVAGRDQQACFR